MNWQEVIETLERYRDLFPLDSQAAVDKAIEACKKQIPKKPYKRKEGKETNYYCSCKHYLGDETEIQLIAIRPRFCDNCGQKIDWSDTNV